VSDANAMAPNAVR